MMLRAKCSDSSMLSLHTRLCPVGPHTQTRLVHPCSPCKHEHASQLSNESWWFFLQAWRYRRNYCCLGSEMLGRCWVPWCSLRWTGQFSFKPPEPVSPGCESTQTSCSCSSLLFCVSNKQTHLWAPAQTHVQTWGVKAQPSALKRGFCWGVQQSRLHLGTHQQGPADLMVLTGVSSLVVPVVEEAHMWTALMGLGHACNVSIPPQHLCCPPGVWQGLACCSQALGGYPTLPPRSHSSPSQW